MQFARVSHTLPRTRPQTSVHSHSNSSETCRLGFIQTGHTHRHRSLTHLTPRAEDSSNNNNNKDDNPEDDSLLEALERSVKARKGAKAAIVEAARPPPRPTTQPLTGVNAGGKWPEGQLFPDRWDQLDLLDKVTVGMYGERGFLFWLNKLAFASIGGLVVIWILFRFVGPATGLYQLADGPPNF